MNPLISIEHLTTIFELPASIEMERQSARFGLFRVIGMDADLLTLDTFVTRDISHP